MPADHEEPEKLPLGVRAIVIVGLALLLWAVILGAGFVLGNWLRLW